MIFVTAVISSNEWIKLHEQASRSWPNEELSRGEILRRLRRSLREDERSRTGNGT
jgi:hypothetical protein